MPSHHEKRILPYTPQQLFELVADVEKYQEFLPWCASSRINWRKENQFNADVAIGYKIFQEMFTSTVTLQPYQRIDVIYEHGPFTHLTNYWTFQQTGRKNMPHCELEFFVDFQFHSGILNGAMTAIFQEAVHSMIGAFEKRAAAIYK
jgi:coenzyme Q-binding protein COQ10